MTPGRNTNELRQTSADAATRTTASPPLTLAAWFAQRSQAEPQRVAYCRRQLGVWADVSWGDYSGQARRAVQVMRSLGVGAGDRVRRDEFRMRGQVLRHRLDHRPLYRTDIRDDGARLQVRA